MSQNKSGCTTLCLSIGVLLLLTFSSCSNQKNTALSRFYHSVNTRYNIHFNAEEAYKEALKAQYAAREDNLSEMLYIFPDNSDSTSLEFRGGDYTTTIDKTTKAIKLHSIKTKPKRDPNRRNDKEYQAWLQQKEYTPFMDKVWLLLARAEFNEGNYLRAITTFMYITKIYSTNPDIVGECQLWIARAYTEMGWMYEAGNILHKIELAGGAPESQKNFYSAVKANYLIRNNEHAAAIPHLEIALKKEKNKQQKLRMKYLLAQLYVEIGDNVNADKSFAAIHGMNTPYLYSFNARLQQLQLKTDLNKSQAIASLTKMGASSKNKEYLDQVYYTIGNIHLQDSDTLVAIDNYRKAIDLSTRNGYDKTVAEVILGDIYFDRREFVPAQPLYSAALKNLKKSHEAYPRVTLRSEALDELVVHVKTVHLQDSLQYLARLSEDERLQVINNKIDALKKQEDENRKKEDRERQMEESQNRISTWGDLDNASTKEPIATPIQNKTDNSFYFYNEQAVTQGRIAFQKQWGNRKLEDDWRRRNKSSSSLDLANLDENQITETSDPTAMSDIGDAKDQAAVDDVYSVDYYLQQLPLSDEAMKASDELIEDALFNMGKIYKDKLRDTGLAVSTFETNIRRFPQTPNLEEMYYQLLLIYMQSGDSGMMATYRNRLLSEFPNGKYTTPLSDPNYEWNFRHLPIIEDSLYTAAYNAYLSADVQTTRNNYQDMKSKYPFTDLMPKFELLNALSYAQTRDIKNLESHLKELAEKYPKADVSTLATDILQRIKDGKIILSDGSPITEFDWSRAYMGGNALTDADGQVLAYSDSLDTEYLLLLMFEANTIDRNELLYEVADYNFSNYVIQTFDLSFDSDPPYEVLQMKGFKSFANIRSYLNKALVDNGLINKIDANIKVVPISVENYTKVFPRLGMDQYKEFFAEHYAELLPQFIAYWDGVEIKPEDFAEKKEPVEGEDKEDEIELNIEPKEETEIAEIVRPEQQKTPVDKTKPKKEEENDKQITADDLLTKDQLEKIGKINDAVGHIISNPVDGIKNLFGKNKYKENLTKEEKLALKEEEKKEKQHQKELKAIEKAKQDSVKKVEKAIQDSIKSEERLKEQQQKMEEQQQKNAQKELLKAKENERKQKEEDRKNRIRQQEEQKRQQEKERKEKEKNREAERKEKERLQNERLKQREKDREEREKARDMERKEKEKQAEERRKS